MKKNPSFLVEGGRTAYSYFLLLPLMAGVFFVSPARADMVGINFVGGSQERGTPAPIESAELAGSFRQKFWNNTYGKSGTLVPVGDDEKGSSVSYPDFSISWVAFQTNAHPIEHSRKEEAEMESPPNYRLGLGYLEATAEQPATVTLSNIPDQFAGAGRSYSLVVYFTLDNVDFKNNASGDKVNIFTVKGTKIGEKTICGLQPSGTKPPLVGWVAVPGKSTTDECEKTPAGNYVIFSQLTDKDITLTATGGFASDGDPRAAINAIQIIP